MSIETSRLILRKITLSDANEMFTNWASDPIATKYLTWYQHKDISETKTIIAGWLKEKNAVRFGIVLKKTNELIGSIDVVRVIDGVPEIGYVLSRRYWNHGYMSEACNAFVKYLFSLGYSKIVVGAHKENEASNKVIVKCGFKFVTQKTTINKNTSVLVNYYELTNN